MKKKSDFESQMARLQQIVSSLEGGELPLEKGIELYKEGMALVRDCRSRLEQARHEVQVLSHGKWEPFGQEQEKEQDEHPSD
jgi:exodeoxyribonuclease VII small subunit